MDESTSSGPGRIALMGGGSWATALAKLLLQNGGERIVWYMRRPDRIAEFRRLGHNPAYLSDVALPIERIDFTSDINAAAAAADTLLLALPSPYFKSHLDRLSADIAGKAVAVATKGIIPDENMLVGDYLAQRYGVAGERTLVVSGPCHAEEVAMGRLSYLTVASTNAALARAFARRLEGPGLLTRLSSDVRGIQYGGVLKNVYAIASGIVHGIKAGDNFQAILVANAAEEMERFISRAVGPHGRQVCHSVYLGDLLVTAYSRFSRNHNLGSMIGRGCPVRRAMMEMEMVAEGYHAAKCMHMINQQMGVDMPILDAVYDILYRSTPPAQALESLSRHLI